MNESSMDDLPEPIIQHILSFLPAKEAARTTLLSNSWRKAWLTRPNLAFQEFCLSGYKIWDLAKKTIQRYEESNLRIQSLTLRVADVWHFDFRCNELIAKSLKLGATHLDLDLDPDFVFPHEIVFGSEKLVGLSVEGCKIELAEKEIMRCRRLESLSLNKTDISPETLSNIFSSCPSIRKFSLTMTRLQKKESAIRYFDLGGLMNLHSLTHLELLYVKFDTTLFFGNLLSLKELTLHTFSTTTSQDNVIRISSRSLERLNFAQYMTYDARYDKTSGKSVRYKFDVPSMRRFNYKGTAIPRLSFESTSRDWESRVSIERRKKPASIWFCRLNKFLTKLRRSKIRISLEFVGCLECFDFGVRGLSSSSGRPRVENLTVFDMKNRLDYLNCFALFDKLFQVCRPKLITQYLDPDQSRADGEANSEYFLCKAFIARQEGTSQESHFVFSGLRDLEEVSVEVFDKEMAVWRFVPMKSLLDFDASTNEKREIRFRLTWKRT